MNPIGWSGFGGKKAEEDRSKTDDTPSVVPAEV